MKKFVLLTTSQSSDHYVYFIEHPEEPTPEELETFLAEHACDKDDDDGTVYEYVDSVNEIKDDLFITIPKK